MPSACSVQSVDLRDFFQRVHMLKELANFLRRLRPFPDSVAVFLLRPHFQSMSDQELGREHSLGSRTSPARTQIRVLVVSSSSGR
jgi:hypothetical protein